MGAEITTRAFGTAQREIPLASLQKRKHCTITSGDVILNIIQFSPFSPPLNYTSSSMPHENPIETTPLPCINQHIRLLDTKNANSIFFYDSKGPCSITLTIESITCEMLILSSSCRSLIPRVLSTSSTSSRLNRWIAELLC